MVRPRESTPILGLDLAYWWPHLVRLVTGKYGRWIRREGMEPEDVCSETARRILVANRSNPYDPTRCAPAVYILIQARSAISHMVVTRRRWAREDLVFAEAPAQRVESSDPLSTLTEDLSRGMPERTHIVRMYLEGHRVSEIVDILRLPHPIVAETIQLVRARARARYPSTEDQ